MNDRMLRLGMWAQRRAYAMPAPVRRIAGRALRRRTARARGVTGPVDDWAIPLVPTEDARDVTALPQAESSAAAPGAAAARAPTGCRLADPTPVRCVIATGVLDVGGAEEVAAFLSRRLPVHDFETVVGYAGTHVPGHQGPGSRLARTLAAEGVATQLLTPDRAKAWLRAWRPDVISAHYGGLGLNTVTGGEGDWLLDAAVDLDIPWVETLHVMPSFRQFAWWEQEQMRAKQVSAQVAVSDLVRRHYLARNPSYPADRIVTVPNGIDGSRVRLVDRAAARSALGLAGEFLFLSLSRYCLQKNTFGLVSAFDDVAREHPQAHLLVAGRADDPLYYEQTRQRAAASPYSNRIHLRGHCPNPPALLAAADGFVLDSFYEGWSLASMEALASGVPVVLSDVGGAREQLAGGRFGYLVANPSGADDLADRDLINSLRFRDQPNRRELAAAMSAVIRDWQHWTAQRHRLRGEALARFSPDDCLAGHANVLRSVARGRPTQS